MGHSYHEFMFIQTRTVLHARLGAAKKRLAWRTVVAFSGGVGLVPRGLAAVGFGYSVGRIETVEGLTVLVSAVLSIGNANLW